MDNYGHLILSTIWWLPPLAATALICGTLSASAIKLKFELCWRCCEQHLSIFFKPITGFHHGVIALWKVPGAGLSRPRHPPSFSPVSPPSVDCRTIPIFADIWHELCWKYHQLQDDVRVDGPRVGRATVLSVWRRAPSAGRGDGVGRVTKRPITAPMGSCGR